MQQTNKPKRMTTTVERVFRPLPNGLYREITLTFINFLNEDGSIKSSKLNQEVEGSLFRRARSDSDISQWGEVLYQFPGEDTAVRMLAIGRTSGAYVNFT